jgi:tetraacyldisaccharide 4'-kinase
MRQPDFWQDSRAPLGRLLAPLGWIYAAVTARRLATARPWRPPVPVICVGNLNIGGTGKTPVVRDLTARLARNGRNPAILSRGFGGSLRGPVLVDRMRHTADQVGDEPLLLSQDATCWVSRDRALGARAAIDHGAGALVMDDGLQNPALVQDLRLIVVDGATGFGNGRAIPAGPLREQVAAGIARADALVLLGDDIQGIEQQYGQSLPILRAALRLRDRDWLARNRVVAFAGIGLPDKFRRSLAEADAEIAGFHPFPDHHSFTTSELQALASTAEREKAVLVTTEKDCMRLSPAWRGRIKALPADLIWRDESAVTSLLNQGFADG